MIVLMYADIMHAATVLGMLKQAPTCTPQPVCEDTWFKSKTFLLQTSCKSQAWPTLAAKQLMTHTDCRWQAMSSYKQRPNRGKGKQEARGEGKES